MCLPGNQIESLIFTIRLIEHMCWNFEHMCWNRKKKKLVLPLSTAQERCRDFYRNKVTYVLSPFSVKNTHFIRNVSLSFFLMILRPRTIKTPKSGDPDVIVCDAENSSSGNITDSENLVNDGKITNSEILINQSVQITNSENFVRESVQLNKKMSTSTPTPLNLATVPFTRNDASSWFQQLEAIFLINNVEDDNIKYAYVQARVDPVILSDVKDFFQDPPNADKYEALKKRIIV